MRDAMEDKMLDSQHPMMLRHPLTGKMVYVDVDVVMRVAEYYIRGDGMMSDIPRPWRQALMHYKRDILRLKERGRNNVADDLCAGLKSMSLDMSTE